MKRNVIYPVIFTETNDKNNTILIYIPDINGMTEGTGIADAIAMAKDYIGNTLFNKRDSEIPKASEINEIKLNSSPFFGLTILQKLRIVKLHLKNFPYQLFYCKN